MFVRIEDGIRRFEHLIKDADQNNIWKRLADLQRRYEFECPKCGKKFWLTPELIKTSWASGKLEGYRCPDPECGGIAKLEKEAA
jgi:phage terminase large subunit GpA-like protein